MKTSFGSRKSFSGFGHIAGRHNFSFGFDDYGSFFSFCFCDFSDNSFHIVWNFDIFDFDFFHLASPLHRQTPDARRTPDGASTPAVFDRVPVAPAAMVADIVKVAESVGGYGEQVASLYRGMDLKKFF